MQQKPPEVSSGFSRREFLRGVGAGSVAGGLLAAGMPDEAAAADPREPVGPDRSCATSWRSGPRFGRGGAMRAGPTSSTPRRLVEGEPEPDERDGHDR